MFHFDSLRATRWRRLSIEIARRKRLQREVESAAYKSSFCHHSLSLFAFAALLIRTFFLPFSSQNNVVGSPQQQQGARFLSLSRDRSSPTLPNTLAGQCAAGNNNHPLMRPCKACPTKSCEHLHASKQPGDAFFNDSCRR